MLAFVDTSGNVSKVTGAMVWLLQPNCLTTATMIFVSEQTVLMLMINTCFCRRIPFGTLQLHFLFSAAPPCLLRSEFTCCLDNRFPRWWRCVQSTNIVGIFPTKSMNNALFTVPMYLYLSSWQNRHFQKHLASVVVSVHICRDYLRVYVTSQ